MAQNGHALALPTAQPGHNGMVFRIKAVTRQRGKIIDQSLNIIAAMRAIGVARHLRLLPRVEIFIKLLNLVGHFALKTVNLFNQINAVSRAGIAQLANLPFQLGNRFFKFQITLAHHLPFAPKLGRFSPVWQVPNGKRVCILQQGFFAFFQNMRVNLRRRNIGMPQHMLNGA